MSEPLLPPAPPGAPHRAGRCRLPPTVPVVTGRVARPVLAGVVTALVGFAGSFPVVLAGLRAVGADEPQAASGLLAVCVASGIFAMLLGLRTRMPVASRGRRPARRCWSPTGPQPGGFPAAVGAFLRVRRR